MQRSYPDFAPLLSRRTHVVAEGMDDEDYILVEIVKCRCSFDNVRCHQYRICRFPESSIITMKLPEPCMSLCSISNGQRCRQSPVSISAPQFALPQPIFSTVSQSTKTILEWKPAPKDCGKPRSYLTTKLLTRKIPSGKEKSLLMKNNQRYQNTLMARVVCLN